MSTKTYPFAIIDAPGYSGNRASIYSRHSTLSAARRALRAHYVDIPGNGWQMSACIVGRHTSADEKYVFWDGIRAANYQIHGV